MITPDSREKLSFQKSTKAYGSQLLDLLVGELQFLVLGQLVFGRGAEIDEITEDHVIAGIFHRSRRPLAVGRLLLLGTIAAGLEPILTIMRTEREDVEAIIGKGHCPALSATFPQSSSGRNEK